MKNKKIFCVIIAVIVISIISYIIVTINHNSKNNNTIPNGYIAIFQGGVGERTYETYIYKLDNEYSNSGFDYINVINTTTYWGSTEWDTEIKKRGSVQWPEEIFRVAKEHGAYSFVKIPNSDKMYTIEEYMEIFLMK